MFHLENQNNVVSAAQAGANQMMPTQVSPMNVGPNAMMPTQVSPAQMGPNQMFPTQVSPAQLTPVHVVEPCTTDALARLLGCCVCIETTRGPIEGVLVDVRNEFVMLQLNNGHQALVRTAEIVWVVPL